MRSYPGGGRAVINEVFVRWLPSGLRLVKRISDSGEKTYAIGNYFTEFSVTKQEYYALYQISYEKTEEYDYDD